jgi:hypothetical protein
MSEARDWAVYHWDLNSYSPGSFNPNEVYLKINSNDGASSSASVWHLQPTDTHFSVGTNDLTNKNGETYVAYIFAGGESTAATARAIEFDGSDDQLNIPDSTDWDLGNGDFTLETWIKSTQTTDGYFTALGQWTTHNSPDYGWAIRYASIDIGTGWSFFYSTTGSNYITTMGSDISDGQWHHIAVTRTGGKLRTFTDGILNTTRSTTDTFNTSGTTMKIGGQDTSGNYFDGRLSNVRLVKGTALYTSSFRPPTEPLTNVTNTKLLCCNNSSTTGSTVTPGTITASGSPVTTKNNHPIPSPFSDPAGFKFGESKSEPVIKCGTYIGNGTGWQPGDNPPNLGLFVECGFEPQWVMLKRTSPTGVSWKMVTCMTGMGNNVNGEILAPNTNSAGENDIRIWAESTGFRLGTSSSQWNYDGGYYAFVAIRRSDGYVGKPPSLGTGVFAMDYSNGSSFPNFDSNFIVDYWLARNPTDTDPFTSHGRLTGDKYMRTSTTGSESSSSLVRHDSNVGVGVSFSSDYLAWMWSRGKGFDVVAYNGDGVAGRQIRHSMNQSPEMIWIKNRDRSDWWAVYHQGLNGGTNPWNYQLKLNEGDSESASAIWDYSEPTSTHFAVGGANTVNCAGEHLIAMLFASTNDINGNAISKVGSYTGTGTSSSSTQTITTGFQPRFLLLKNVTDNGEYWQMLDTTRGWTSSSNKRIYPNDSRAQDDNKVIGEPLSTGFTVTDDDEGWNKNNSKYIYYAHA